MAIYHCSMKSVSRGAGQSIVAAAAYRHACKLEDSRTGEVHDYSRKRGLESSQIYLPSGVKVEWAQDRAQLWNTAEAAEKRKNARLGRELVLALPAELTKEQRRELAGVLARHIADRYGVAVDVAIHQPNTHGDQRNHHVHMLMSSRRITPEGFGEKARELDDHERGPVEVEHIRAQWARLANRALERAGHHVQIDHRSLEAQGIKRMPSLHLGPSASAMERRGVQTRLGNRNRAAQVLNAQATAFEQERQQSAEVQEKTKAIAERENLKQQRAEGRREDFEIAAYVAREMFNCDAKALLEDTGYPSRQIASFLENMKIIQCIDEDYTVIQSIENRFWTSDVQKFCLLKKSIGEKVRFDELSLNGMYEFLRKYTQSYVTIKKEPYGSELLKIAELRATQAQEVLSALDMANRNLTQARYALSNAQKDLDEHNEKFDNMGFVKRLLHISEINNKAKYIENELHVCEADYIKKKKLVDELTKKSIEYSARAKEARAEYERSPYGQAVAKATVKRTELEKKYGQAVRKLVCPNAPSIAHTLVEYKQYLDKMQASTPEQFAEMVKNIQHAERRYEVQELFYSVAERTSHDTSISGRQRVRDEMLKKWDKSTPEQRGQMEQYAKEFLKTHQRQRSRSMGMDR